MKRISLVAAAFAVVASGSLAWGQDFQVGRVVQVVVVEYGDLLGGGVADAAVGRLRRGERPADRQVSDAWEPPAEALQERRDAALVHVNDDDLEVAARLARQTFQRLTQLFVPVEGA